MESSGRVNPLLRRRVEPERAAEVQAGSAELSGRLDRNLVVVALALVAAVMVLQFVVGGMVSALVDGPHDDEAASLARDLGCAVAVIAVLGSLGWWRRVGFTGPSHWRKPYLLVPLALFAGLRLLDTDIDLSDGTRAALELPQQFLTGLWEEGLIRGFLLFALLIAAMRAGRGPWPAVIGSAAIFGLLHLFNLLNGADPAATAIQVLLAGLSGSASRRCSCAPNALWLLVLLHAVIDLPLALEEGKGGERTGFDTGSVIFGLLFALYGVFLLRRAKDGDLPGAPR